MQQSAPGTSPRPRLGKQGILLRVGIFALTGIGGLVIFAPLMHPVAGYFVAAALSTFAAAAVANTMALRIYERGNLANVGLGWSADSRRNLLLGLAGGLGGAALVVGPALLVGAARWVPDPQWQANPGGIPFLLIVLLFGAVGEELLFRGYGFQVLLEPIGEFATILPMSVLFGLAHSNNQNATMLGLLNTSLWGLLFGLAFLRSRDLWLPIGLHYGWNIALPLFGVNLSGFTMNVTGYAIEWQVSDRWSGGAYGPEGGLLTTMVLALLFAALRKAPVRKQVAFLYQPEEEQ